jgi:hypothetical protein
MKHPKIQALIGGKARREIELQIVEQLLDDPDCDLSAMDMEYWHGLHDKLREKLTAATPQPAPAREPVAYMMINKTHQLAPSLHFAPPEWHPSWEAIPLYAAPQPASAVRQCALWVVDAYNSKRPDYLLRSIQKLARALDAAPAAPDAQKGAA